MGGPETTATATTTASSTITNADFRQSVSLVVDHFFKHEEEKTTDDVIMTLLNSSNNNNNNNTEFAHHHHHQTSSSASAMASASLPKPTRKYRVKVDFLTPEDARERIVSEKSTSSTTGKSDDGESLEANEIHMLQVCQVYIYAWTDGRTHRLIEMHSRI